MSATATTNPQEINGSVPFRRCLPLRGTVNMTEKEIREAVKNKENYSSIVTYFKTQKTLSEADLALLIDMIEEMSPEIYEHYRALQDMFREGIRKHLEASKGLRPGHSPGRKVCGPRIKVRNIMEVTV